MPENRPFPWKFIPRLGVKLSVTFGAPLSPQDIEAVLRKFNHQDRHRHPSESPPQHLKGVCDDRDADHGEYRLDGVERIREHVTRESINMDLENESRKREIDHVRSLITAVVQQSVEAVGRRVSGDTLGKKMGG